MNPSDRNEVWRGVLRSVGRRYHDCRLSTFECTTDKQRVAVDQLTAYAANVAENVNAGRSIVLYGPPGTGKDHLLVGVAFEAVKAGLTLLWRNTQDWFSANRDLMDSGESELRWVREHAAVDVLVLSDPVPPKTGSGASRAAGQLTPHQATLLYQILDARYRDMRPTWVTLNIAGGDEAKERLGVQVYDRLRHNGLTLACGWGSYRAQ